MFHPIPPQVEERMRTLEAIDARDRQDGTPRLQRLRQIPPETGRFLALLAASAPEGQFVEIGASAGYSSLWIALACLERGTRLTTFEIMPDKVRLSQETIQLAGMQEAIELVPGDARVLLREYIGIAFCFLDAEKESYTELYELIVPRMVTGGIFLADNAINHRETLQPMLDRALNDERVDGMIVPVGKGVLLCRRI